MAGYGTTRQFAALHQFGRFWSEADMPRPRAAYRSDAIDPKRT